MAGQGRYEATAGGLEAGWHGALTVSGHPGSYRIKFFIILTHFSHISEVLACI